MYEESTKKKEENFLPIRNGIPLKLAKQEAEKEAIKFTKFHNSSKSLDPPSEIQGFLSIQSFQTSNKLHLPS